MPDSYPKLKVAAVQAASAVLDREATLQKLAALDMAEVTCARQLLDVAGHYSRPDVFRLVTP